jgi:hypothetical protein
MIGLMPIGRVIGVISTVYAVFVALGVAITWKFGGSSETIWGSVGYAFAGATPLQAALLVWFYFGWRKLWKLFPALNRLFPDIAGEWQMKIDWQGAGQRGVVNAQATVKQDFLRVSMEVKSPKSESQTLIALPKKDPESGRPLLYYVYLVTPKVVGANPSSPYHGAAILKFSAADGGELSGNYWTTQQTRGHFQLRRRT